MAQEESTEKADTEEAPYRPYTTADDKVIRVQADGAHADAFTRIVRETRKDTSYVRTRFSQVFRALENSGTEHGVRVGRKVSDRMLVNTYCEIRGGDQPTRPYRVTAPTIDMSVAAALVIDESSSMSDKLRQTTAIAYTMLDALDSIGAKTLAVGFRDHNSRHYYDNAGHKDNVDYHRTGAIYYDMFKDWTERFSTVAPRLKEIKATGGTPMADGVEFALNELSRRPEGHRILFVLTDGQPDRSHHRVLKAQIRRAKQAGILLVGVGLGYGSEFVKDTFEDSVFEYDLSKLPKELVTKMELLVRTRHTAAKRGTTVRAA